MWYADSTLVVAISLALFFGILWYAGVHKLIFGALDARAERIRTELDEARRLREEAQETFAEFERKRQDVDAEVAEIVEHAKTEAVSAAEKAKVDLAASIERRLRAADEQIALAEADAVRNVRDRAVAVAVAAASDILADRLAGDAGIPLIDQSIEQVSKRLQ